jgi:hypothetical protein
MVIDKINILTRHLGDPEPCLREGKGEEPMPRPNNLYTQTNVED